MVIINPDKSTYIRSDAPDTSYGANDLIIQGYPTALYRGLIEFDISSITVADVVSAKLRLYLTYESSVTRTHSARRVTSAWSESVTWNTQPTSTATNLASAVIVGHPLNPDRWIEWDVTNLLKDESGSTLGLLMKDSVETSSTGDYFKYSGRTKPEPPQLLIDNDFYVIASGGNDANNGAAWANAWATVDKAAKTVADGATVHIGFGTYNAEPANNDIAPVNAGAVGIKYLPETETTGGGTGSVIVEVN